MDWDRMEEILLGQDYSFEENDERIEFHMPSTPDYIWEHRQNSYEAEQEIQEYREQKGEH